ncbi:hypothetical protein MCUN1_000396 [Malassezia cuniculi]|uniref:Exocyst complex component Sec3 PIP2-binding N-terminal domain-containing protein n=1 Tax=Malassezia cuniculi TaxID=948313 RepID=A0AAF0J4W6_9BASI|nr:hypothetical protein MCUN1_000396 [Malassezia cuniculi]
MPLQDQFTAALTSRGPNYVYIAHLKVYEHVDGAGAPKIRYIILSVDAAARKASLFKAKRNANASLSIGKEWDVSSLRQLDLESEMQIAVTLNRSYRWQAEDGQQPHVFLTKLAAVYEQIAGRYPVCNGWNLQRGLAQLDNETETQTVSKSNVATANQNEPAATKRAPEIRVSKNPTAPAPNDAPTSPPSTHRVTRKSVNTERTHTPPAQSANATAASPHASAQSAVAPAPPLASSNAAAPSLLGALALDKEQRPAPIPAPVPSPAPAAPAPAAAPALSARGSVSRSVSPAPALAVPAPALSLGPRMDPRSRLSTVEAAHGKWSFEQVLQQPGVNEMMQYAALGDAIDADTRAETKMAADRAVQATGEFEFDNDKTEAPEDELNTDRPELMTAPGDNADGDENPTLAHVEEMLEGLEWAPVRVSANDMDDTRKQLGTADAIEERLLAELAAIQASTVHSVIESDDRVLQVIQHLDDTLAYLDQLDNAVSGYKMQLNMRADDIAFIESQNRGLQVQSSNQRLLLQEIEVLISTINVDDKATRALASATIGSANDDVGQLEVAAAALYKSILQARPDRARAGTELAALGARLAECEDMAARFGARLLSAIASLCESQVHILLSDKARMAQMSNSVIPDHASLEAELGRYCGLVLFVKETAPTTFSQLSNAYLTSAARCYATEMQLVFGSLSSQLKSAPEEKERGPTRSGSIRRPSIQRDTAPAPPSGTVAPGDALRNLVSTVNAAVAREQTFLADLLHMNDTNVTFADYMDLEPYFRRRAAVTSINGSRDLRTAIETVFAAFSNELHGFVSQAVSRDPLAIVGVAAALEDAARANDDFVARVCARSHSKLAGGVEHVFASHIHGIEETRIDSRKRRGLVQFVRTLPVLAGRVEGHLRGSSAPDTRAAIDSGFDRIGRAIFTVLQSISKIDGAGTSDEDKGHLNYDVTLIENMHYLYTHVPAGASPALAQLAEHARGAFEMSVSSYVQTVLRRPLGKMIDFSSGIDSLLRTTPANEVTLHNAYSRSSAKKLVRDYTARDIRKGIEALSKRVQKHFDDEEQVGAGTGAGTSDRDETAALLRQVWSTG